MSVRKREWPPEWWKLRKLRAEQDRLIKIALEQIATAKAKGAGASELNGISQETFWEANICAQQIDEILSSRLVRKAQAWGVPVPAMKENGPDWIHSTQLWTWILTEEAAMKLRREIATEMEIAHRPWINWLSLIFSGAGLAVAIVALVISLRMGGGPPNVSP